MKYFFGIVLLLLVSCGNKEDILLPKAGKTIVKDVVDLSPIYIFFRVKGKDTLAEVNRKNSIITTNWILNIDKRLPLRLVIPEVMKLQQRKREEKEHRNELALNYYSYADSIGKNLAFIPFTQVYYKMEKPKLINAIYFRKNNTIQVNDVKVAKSKLLEYLNKRFVENPTQFAFCFDKECSYGSYIQNMVFIETIILSENLIAIAKDQEYVY
ncbi:hypothetical protein KZH69_13120 [Flavobacterium sp. NAS39]|uniref:Lipoprotein n=1 Tax=Flavobacterium taihuense TaxID=2857508 RepID=A0ABS6XXP4_9FLAO|nr:hypothetical protein [Flavobacterium taihuense]